MYRVRESNRVNEFEKTLLLNLEIKKKIMTGPQSDFKIN